MLYGYSGEYIIKNMTSDEVLELYDDGIEFEEIKGDILILKLAEAITGKKIKKKKEKIVETKPDIKKFEKLYGDKIKRPKE